MYALNHMVLNWLKFITLGVNNVLCHNFAQCVWLLYRESDTLLPRVDPGFSRGSRGSSYIIYVYTYIAIIHINIFYQQSAYNYLLCMKLQPTCCRSCSYYALMLLYICTVIYSLAWPDPSSHRGTIACSISAYTANDNAPLCELGFGHVRLGH